MTTTNIWIGNSLPNNKIVRVTAGPNITALVPPPTFKIGLGTTVFTFTGWNPADIVAAWSASSNQFIQAITASVSGSDVLFTANNPGVDFEIVCDLVGGVLNESSTYQSLSFSPAPSGGTFTLTVAGETTSAISYSATPATFASSMQTAIAALSGFGSNDVLVSYDSVHLHYVFDFSQGRFTGTNVAAMTATHTSLTGGNASTTIVHEQVGNVGTSQVDQLSFPIAGSHLGTVSEIQTLSTGALTGTFTLTLPGYGTTVTLPFSAGRSAIQQALEQLVGIGLVTVSGGPLYWTPTATAYPVTITFDGTLGNLPQLIVTVLTGATNEVQRVVMTGNPITSGTINFTFGGQTTSTLQYTADAPTVQAALQALSSIGAGNILATGGPLTLITPVSGYNEIQRLACPHLNLNRVYALVFGGQTTSDLTYEASVATIQAALEALSSIGAGNIRLTGSPLMVATGPNNPINEVQNIASSGDPYAPTNGGGPLGLAYTLSFAGQTTSQLLGSATAAQVQTALQGLSTIGAGNIVVTGGPMIVSSGPTGGTNHVFFLAGSSNTVAYTLTFNGQTTGSLPGDQSGNATAIQSALEGLSTIGIGNVKVTEFGSTATYLVTFQNLLGQQSLTGDLTDTLSSGSGTIPPIADYVVGAFGYWNYSGIGGGFTVTFQGTLAASSQPFVTCTPHTASLYLTFAATTTEITTGSAGTFTYTYNTIDAEFIGTLAHAPQTLMTSTGGTGGGTAITPTEYVLGVVDSNLYSYPPITLTFSGSFAGLSQTLITATHLSGLADPVMSRLVAGGPPIYSVSTVQDGGIQLIQNITGGTFSLVIDTVTVANIPYNTSSTLLASLINAEFGSDICFCTGGPCPNLPTTIFFKNSLGLQPVTVSFLSALATNTDGSIIKTTLSPGATDSAGTNVFDLVVCPGNGTLGINTSTAAQIWITITNTLPFQLAPNYETPVGEIYLPLLTLSADLIEAAINEALASDACRVVQIGRSQEWANVKIPAQGGSGGAPAQWTNFWYMKDTYRITFVNAFAVSGSVAMTASFAIVSSVPAAPVLFMDAVNLAQDPSDSIDFFPEINRVTAGFVAMETAGTPIHQCTLTTSSVITISKLGWRFKLLTQYNAGNTNHTGLVDYPSTGTIQFNWSGRTVSDTGVVSESTIVTSALIDWNSPASTIATVIGTMLGTPVQVVGGLANSWLSEGQVDAPVNGYQDLKVTLIGPLLGLPLDEFTYDLTCTITSPQFSASSSFQKNFKVASDRYSRTLPPHNNHRERLSIPNPGSIATLKIGVGNNLITIPTNATAAQVQAALDTLYPLSVTVASLFPPKLAHPIFVYGTTFADGPMEFEFSSFGLQSNPTVSLVVSSTPGDVTIGQITIITQGVSVQDDHQLLSITGAPYSGTFTLTFGANTASGLAYNISLGSLVTALAAASPSAIVVTSVSGSASTGFTFVWAAAGGPQATLTTTSALNNVADAVAVTNIGGSSSAFTVSELLKGRGPNYADDSNNWSLGRVLNSGDTAVFDDSTSPMLYGIDMTSVFTVSTIGSSPVVAQFIHTRNRQVFDEGQTVEFLTSGTPPTGMTSGTVYTILNAQSSGVFSLSLSGTPVSVTTIGSGTFHLVVSDLTVQVNNQFGGSQIGLPHLNGSSLEYLACYWKAHFDAITIGIAQGDGLSLGRFDTDNAATTIDVETTGASGLSPVPAILFLADNSGTTMTIESGDVGLAYYAEETSLMGSISIVTGTLTVNNATVSTINKGSGAVFRSNNTTVGSTIDLS